MLNRKGWIVLGGTFSLIFLVEGVTNYVARNDDNYSKSYRGEVLIREKISETEINFSDEKNAHLRSGFKSIAHDNNQFREFIHHYVKPVQRTNDILKQISFCLEGICDVSQPNIVQYLSFSYHHYTKLIQQSHRNKYVISIVPIH